MRCALRERGDPELKPGQKAESHSQLFVNALHGRGDVACSGESSCGSDFVDAAQVAGRKLHIYGGDVLLEILDVLRAGDRNDVISLMQQPCK